MTSSAPDSYKKGIEELRRKYSQGVDFIVLTPVFLTLRQQTLQRLKDAGLKNSDGTEPRVLSYKFSADTTVRTCNTATLCTVVLVNTCWCSVQISLSERGTECKSSSHQCTDLPSTEFAGAHLLDAACTQAALAALQAYFPEQYQVF